MASRARRSARCAWSAPAPAAHAAGSPPTPTVRARASSRSSRSSPARPSPSPRSSACSVAEHGRFSFRIAHALGLLGYGALPLAPAVPGGVQHFRSDPALQPAAVKVDENRAPASQGDIFVAPQNGPVQNGPMILDPRGRLVWFYAAPGPEQHPDQRLPGAEPFGQPVLTWWEGNTSNGLGRGDGVIMNSRYQQIATVHAGNGLGMDLHEFLLTPQGDAYIIAAAPVQVPGIKNPTIDEVVQEIDVQTGLVLFEWHALDHIPLSDSYFNAAAGHLHVRPVPPQLDRARPRRQPDRLGAQHLDRLQGRPPQRSRDLAARRQAPELQDGRGHVHLGQHDALVLTGRHDHDVRRRRRAADGASLLARDQSGRRPAQVTTRLLTVYRHSPQISANFEGGVQPLSGGDVFLGWGQQPYFSEDDGSGRQIFDAHFAEPTTTYRAYRFAGAPSRRPAGARLLAPAERLGRGSTRAGTGRRTSPRWRVLAGSSRADAHRHRPIGPQRVRDAAVAAQPRPVLRGAAARGRWHAALGLGRPDRSRRTWRSSDRARSCPRAGPVGSRSGATPRGPAP